jgi:Ca2+-binding EF-hand superfamily protein
MTRTILLVSCALALSLGACNKAPAEQVTSEQAAPAGAETGRGGPQTLEQSLARATARFDRMDKDGDGKVTTAEIAALRAANASEGVGNRNGGGLARADLDNDGVVTRAEVETQARERFQRMDKNGDGTVTPEEREAARQERHNP